MEPHAHDWARTKRGRGKPMPLRCRQCGTIAANPISLMLDYITIPMLSRSRNGTERAAQIYRAATGCPYAEAKRHVNKLARKTTR